ncbi:MAG: 6-pyruvoyl-tetrahydropterin synthase-related protein [Chloroflexi bacterium]|nr:6-pyruvoyl-tetrahydropterin synthase-related protein [Chloroflexota bacterium]
MKTLLWHLLATCLVVGAAFVAYRATLYPASEMVKYPWGSDTWGHLIKVEFLRDEIARGVLFPNVFPDWYAGVQLFRYYAPLPYYAMLLFSSVFKDVFLASSWFIFACAVLGGTSFLLYRPWVGLIPSTMGGILYALIPDNVRVAFAEGNLPRVLATALLPITFFFVLKTMDPSTNRRIHVVALALMISLVVLSHAMMAAIFVVSLALFCATYWLLGGSHRQGLSQATSGLLGGLLLSGWWLLPSLTGGITELNQSAVSEALADFPLSTSFNPSIRLESPEQFYMGMGLGLGALIGIVSWRRLSPLSRAAVLAGGATTLVTTTFFNPVFNSLPMHYLFWPIRFSSFASFALLFALLSLWKLAARRLKLALLVVLLVTLVDFSGSLRLMHLQEADETIIASSRILQQLPGWRVATADLSRLGSSPSYWLSFLGGREQLYGWGYQGARTATNVSAINYAMDHGHFDYAVDRLEELGVDDIVVLSDIMSSPGFDRRLEQAGYRSVQRDHRLTLYHKDGQPRAFKVEYDILGIGRGAQNLAFLFPKIRLGPSPNVDDYDQAYLSRFKALVLSRFSWRDMGKAETAVAEFARRGGRVLVDLTGSPIDVFSRGPKFMGVYGEPIQMIGRASTIRNGETAELLPFSSEDGIWQAITPQGLDREVITFDYYGQIGVALGYKDFGGGRVWFTGLNLPFHALLTGDPAAVQLLEEALESRAGELPERREIKLQDYLASNDGYSFGFSSDAAGEIVVPVAAHEGAMVSLDGRVVKPTIVDNLVAFHSPAGRHTVRVYFEKTGIYILGMGSTVLSLVILVAYVANLPKGLSRLKKRRVFQHAKAAVA